jgi:phosphatidylglycerophosphate synthase
MLDSVLKRLAAPVLARGSQPLVRLGAHADFVSAVGCVVGLAAIPAIAKHVYWLGLVLLLLNRLIDALDGAVARQSRASGRGAVLDMTLDLIVFAGLPFAFALGDPSRGLAASFFVFAIAARGASSVFLATLPGDSLFTFVGRIMEDTELTLAFAVACIRPDWFSTIAYIGGALCFITAGSRIALAAGRTEP